MRSLERLAGAVICAGFPGDRIEEVPLDELRALRPGGLIVFARNVTTAAGTTALVREIETAFDEEAPFVGVDQEGGRVMRFRDAQASWPPMMTLGATGDVTLASEAGRAFAFDVRRFGAGVDFAPVMDIALEPHNTVIGARAFAADARAVADMGVAFALGLQAGGVASVVKHFPGHGATRVDSHLALPHVEADEATLRSREIIPFKRAIEAGVAGVMSSHVVFDALDRDVPATLSPVVLTALLREELHFKGVCFTDSMEMAAIAQFFGTVPAVVAALRAGADSMLVSHDLAVALEARDAIVGAVRSGRVPLERLEEAAARVSRLRQWPVQHAAEPAAPPDGLALRAARSAIKVIDGDLPVRGPVGVVSFEGTLTSGAEEGAGARPSLALALRRRRLHAELMRVPVEPSAPMIAHLLETLALTPERRLAIVMRRAHLHRAQRDAIDALLTRSPDAIVISALEPHDAGLFQGRAQTLIATFGDEDANVQALAERLAG